MSLVTCTTTLLKRKMVKGNKHKCWESAEISQSTIGNNSIDPPSRLWIILEKTSSHTT